MAAPLFLFASGKFTEALTIFDRVSASCDKDAFTVILQELLHNLFVNDCHRPSWCPAMGLLLDFCREHDIVLPLITAIIGTAYWSESRQFRLADWIRLWRSQAYAAVVFASDFLQGIADYLATQPRYPQIIPTLASWRQSRLLANEYLALLKIAQPTSLARILPNFVADLFSGEQWQKIIVELVSYYHDNGIIDILGLNLMDTIANIRELPPDDPKIRQWMQLWQHQAGSAKELRIAVAYLEVAVEFHTSGDSTVFGKLCAADREIILAYFPGLANDIKQKFADF